MDPDFCIVSFPIDALLAEFTEASVAMATVYQLCFDLVSLTAAGGAPSVELDKTQVNSETEPRLFFVSGAQRNRDRTELGEYR